MAAQEETKNEEEKVVSLSAWKKKAVHTVRLPSGAFVNIKVPDLSKLIEAGEIPQNLMDVAIAVASGTQQEQKPSAELVGEQRAFTDKLVQLTVIEPKITDDAVDDVPYEDKDLIVALATRQRDMDAEGSHIGGLDKSEKFRKFRELDRIDTPLDNV